jgi:four helix bundle protein
MGIRNVEFGMLMEANTGSRINVQISSYESHFEKGNTMNGRATSRDGQSSNNLQKRTKAFALRVIRLVERLPNSKTADVLGRQLLRSGTSVGANYRSACRARSPAEFCSKMGIVEEEADESGYWMELLADSGAVKAHLLHDLLNESGEIVAMAVASIRTTRSRNRRG